MIWPLFRLKLWLDQPKVNVRFRRAWITRLLQDSDLTKIS